LADESFEVTLRVNLDAGNLSGQLSGELGRVKNQYSGFDSEIQKVQKSLMGAAAAQDRMAQGLSTTRYALYDVASTFTAISAAALAMAAGSTAVAVAWERDFAQVIRTSQLAGDEINTMRDSLIDLAQTMPIAFGDITQIATLAGQLGIAKDEVADFTETVAKFSAISDVSVEAAATAFGRLDSLIPSVNGNFEALGSSIAKVAVESVATESQIISIATQIAGIGNFAGLTADQVVGLSGALASVGTQPELSRGLVTRLFTNMSIAVSDSGERLEKFAQIAGVSGAEFQAAFGTEKMGPILESFISGLGQMQANGEDTVDVLSDLGIVSVRDVTALLRLASASDVVSASFANSKEGFKSASELNKQYGVIAETTAAKLQILGNNFAAFLNSLGSASTGPLNQIVGHFSEILQVITDFISTPFGQSVALIVVAITGLLGALAALGAAMAVGYAGIIAMQQALVGLGIAANGVGLKALVAQLAAAGGAGKAAAVGIQAAGLAVKGLGLALAGLIAADVATGVLRGIGDAVYELQGKSQDGGAALERLGSSMGEANKYFEGFWTTVPDVEDGAARLNRAFAAISPDTALRDIALADEYLARMAEGGDFDAAREHLDELRKSYVDGGGDLDSFKIAFTDAYDAIAEASKNAAADSSGMSTVGDQLMNIEQDAQEAKAALDAVRQAILNIGNTSISEAQALINLNSAINQMNDAAEQADVTLTGTNDTSLAYQNSLIQVDLAAREAALSMLDNGKSADEATAAYERGRQALIDSIAAKTGDREAAVQWADTVLGKTDEVIAGVAAYGEQVNQTPELKNTEFTENTPQAGENVLQYIRRVDGTPKSKHTDLFHTADRSGREISEYIRKVDSTPPSKNTDLQNNSWSAKYGVDSYINSVNSIPWYRSTTINTHYTVSGAVGYTNSSGQLAGPGYATGGAIYGAGTGTSDSIPILASNGEFMMTAAAHNYYGSAFMNAVNSLKWPKFAQGGPITNTVQQTTPMMGVVELGPKSLAAVAQQAAVNVMLDAEALSRTVERGNRSRRARGDMR
jgi:TP901 family phage tail tape measure protein